MRKCQKAPILNWYLLSTMLTKLILVFNELFRGKKATMSIFFAF